MPWTTKKPPSVAKNWSAKRQRACVKAANAALGKGKNEREAIMACVGAAKENKSMEIVYNDNDKPVGLILDGEVVTLDELADEYKAVALSLGEQESRVRRAFCKRYKETAGPLADSMDEPWVKDVFDDTLIAEQGGRLFRYPYTLADSGEIAFGDGERVEIQYTPVAEAPTAPVAGKSLAIKALREEDGGVVVGGYMALWGTSEQKDLGGDYFRPETELGLGWYPTVPAMFHHALDKKVGLAPIGQRVEAKTDETGLWVEDWLNKSSDYWAMVEPLLAAEKLFYSPGSAPHLVRREDDGQLKAFPIVEDTLTPIPMQHRLLPVDQVKAAYKSAGLEIPELGEPSNAGAGASGKASEVERLRVLNRQQIRMNENQLMEV